MTKEGLKKEKQSSIVKRKEKGDFSIMTQFEKTVMLRENVMPVALKTQEGVSEPEQLLEEKAGLRFFPQ